VKKVVLLISLNSESDSAAVPGPLSVVTRGAALTTLIDFQTAAPLAVRSEDFEDNVATGAFQICVGDINSMTNNTCFSPGQIVEGINITTVPPGDTVLLPPGFMGLTDSV